MFILQHSRYYRNIQGVSIFFVDNELFTPRDDNNTQQQYSTSGPIFISIRDKLHPFLAIIPWKTSIYKPVLPSKK